MSRCVLFPPPGYVWNGVSGEALIQLLKLRRESTEAEKRRRRKEKKKERENGKARWKRSHQHRRHKDKKSNKGQGRSDDQKKREYETQGLENSSLTEELSQPMVSDSLYDSSDDSQSIKRKKPNWSCNGCHKRGSIIETDFLLQKHKDQEVLTSKSFCSPPTRTDFDVQEKFEMTPRHSNEQFCSTFNMSRTVAQDIAFKPCREPCHSSSQRTEVVASDEDDTAPTSNFNESGSVQIESQFRKLIVSWVPLPMQSEHTDFDDQAWLCERRLPRSDTNGVHKSSNEDLCDGSSALYPYASYLPQADTYALPFTIPF